MRSKWQDGWKGSVRKSSQGRGGGNLAGGLFFFFEISAVGSLFPLVFVITQL